MLDSNFGRFIPRQQSRHLLDCKVDRPQSQSHCCS